MAVLFWRLQFLWLATGFSLDPSLVMDHADHDMVIDTSSAASLYMQTMYAAVHWTQRDVSVTAVLPLDSNWEGSTLSATFSLDPELKKSSRMEVGLKLDMDSAVAKYLFANHNVEVCANSSCQVTVGVLRRNVLSGDTWIVYDITHAMSEFLKQIVHNHYTLFNLTIRFDNVGNKSYALDDQPILVAHIGDGHRSVLRDFGKRSLLPSRTRRSRVKEKVDANSPCHLQSWYVDFRDLKWNEWIIQPKGYLANFCVGRCDPQTDRVNVTNHAYVKSVYRSMNAKANTETGLALPPSYCVPLRLAPLHLLYVSNNSIHLRTMQELSATNCGCL